MYILGIWDGHDSGAALMDEKSILYAANEERFTKRKLDINFPSNTIKEIIKNTKINPEDITDVVFTTTEFTKALERLFPKIKENYYTFRRRKILKPRFTSQRHKIKYRITQIGPLPLSESISRYQISNNLKRVGIKNFKLHVVDHHTAHASTAAFTSKMKDSLIITMDGLGDGISATISALEGGVLKRKEVIKARDSIGILYEQATNILGMRELEDEGKVMAMANYSYPFDFENNKLKKLFSIDGTKIKALYSPQKQFEVLERIAWQTPREQFAYMIQQLTEKIVISFVKNAINKYSIGDVAFAGGLFSNIKINMLIRNLDGLKSWYVFPHMGDGGMALGSALYYNYEKNGVSNINFNSYLGSEYTKEETINAIKNRGLEFSEETNNEISSHASEIISNGDYAFWFNGRAEYGPRALGNRSIIAPSDLEEVKEKLNIYVKQREWFQPFAPSMLEEECDRLLEYDNKGIPKFMTMGYMVKKEFKNNLKSVIHIDGSARPQAVGDENPLYRDMLKGVKRRKGHGIVLNTSFNIHGSPIVMDPSDAVDTMIKTRAKHMFINGIYVNNVEGV